MSGTLVTAIIRAVLVGVAAGWVGITACGEEPPGAVFSRDFEETYIEVRSCFPSHEHELRYIRIFADPVSAEIFDRCVRDFTGCTETFPVGSTFVKLEYDFEDCESFIEYTAARKEEPGSLPEGGDWRWQRVSRSFDVKEDGAPETCLRCHIDHCSPPYGMDLRCSEE